MILENINIRADASLMLAVLNQAIIDVKSHDRIIRQTALDWIFDDGSDYEYSFSWILQTLTGRVLTDQALSKVRTRMLGHHIQTKLMRIKRHPVNKSRVGVGLGRRYKHFKNRIKEDE